MPSTQKLVFSAYNLVFGLSMGLSSRIRAILPYDNKHIIAYPVTLRKNG